MSKSRRDFLRNTVLGAGLVTTTNALAGANPGFAAATPSGAPSEGASGESMASSGANPQYPDTPPGRATIRPSIARLKPGQTQQFRAIIEPPVFSFAHVARRVTWTVNDIEGGNSQWGTIDSTGLYRAPSTAPVPHEVHICAKVEGVMNPNLFANVLIGVNTNATLYKLKSSWTDKEGRLVYPHSINLDPQGNILIADSVGSRVFRYSKDGRFLTAIGAGSRLVKGPDGKWRNPRPPKGHHPSLAMGYFGGTTPGFFSDPRVAVANKAGDIYVCDTAERRPQVQVFDSSGNFKFAFAQHGVLPGHMIRVHGMCFDSKGRLITEDVEDCRVNTYEANGKFVGSWGHQGTLPGTLNAPHCIYIDPNDEAFIVGYYGPTQKFTAGGHYLRSFAPAEPPDQPISFQSIFGDRWGNVYVPKRDEGLQKYNNFGEFVGWVTRGVGTQWGAVDDDGTLYLLPTSTSKAQKKTLPTVAIYSPV